MPLIYKGSTLHSNPRAHCGGYHTSAQLPRPLRLTGGSSSLGVIVHTNGSRVEDQGSESTLVGVES
eukprot:221834-Rhodomonas_salina.1